MIRVDRARVPFEYIPPSLLPFERRTFQARQRHRTADPRFFRQGTVGIARQITRKLLQRALRRVVHVQEQGAQRDPRLRGLAGIGM